MLLVREAQDMGEQASEHLSLRVGIRLHRPRELVDPRASLEELAMDRGPLLGARGAPGHDRAGARRVPVQGIAVLVALRDREGVGQVGAEPPGQGRTQLRRGQIDRVANGPDRVVVGQGSGAE
jgi:hypothetical protein